MNLSDNVEIIAATMKLAFAMSLEKAGHTLQELEEAMTTRDNTKTAALLQKVGITSPLDMLGTLINGLTSGAEIAGGSALGVGALGGLGLYGAYKGIHDSRKKQEENEQVLQKLDQARRELLATGPV